MIQSPKLAVLAVVIKDDTVLLVRRKNKPDARLWGYPGGHVEWGETVAQAALRELREETGIAAQAGDDLGYLDIISRSDRGEITHHFCLLAVLCHWRGGTPIAGDDVDGARFVPIPEVFAGTLPMSARVGEFLQKAMDQLSGKRV